MWEQNENCEIFFKMGKEQNKLGEHDLKSTTKFKAFTNFFLKESVKSNMQDTTVMKCTAFLHFVQLNKLLVLQKAVVVAVNNVFVAAEAMRKDEQENAHSEMRIKNVVR